MSFCWVRLLLPNSTHPASPQAVLQLQIARPQHTHSPHFQTCPLLRRLWANSRPQGANTGMSLNMLRAAGTLLDYVLVMSYDAGDKTTTGYDPVVRGGGAW